MDIEKLKLGLADAGCVSDESDDIVMMCINGNMKDALQKMRKNRCRLMDEFHESGRKVDCLDFLIRQTEKEIKQAE